MADNPAPFKHSGALFGCLLLALCVAYYPSLYHIARADQIYFLIEYAGRDNSLQTLIDSMYYNRTRHLAVGDPLLFRPLLFAILTLQRFAFGYHYIYWQMAALSAHLFAVWSLWRLLHRWAGNSRGAGFVAWVFTIFFAFLFVNTEAVIWHGIVPYVFFAGLVLLAFERLEAFIASAGADRRAMWGCSLLMLAAVLTYEAGCWYTLCFYVFALISLRRSKHVRRTLVLIIPLIIYVSWSAGHWFLMHIQPDNESSLIQGRFFSLDTYAHFLYTLKLFFLGGFFLRPYEVVYLERLFLSREVFSMAWPFDAAWTALRWLGAGVLAFYLFLMIAVARHSHWRRECGRTLLLLAMIAGYLLIIVAGRFNTRFFGGLNNTIYYNYNFWILLTPVLFLSIRNVFSYNVRLRVMALIFSVLVAIFSFYNALNIYELNSRIKTADLISRAFLRSLDLFVEEHKHEPDFSFSFPADDRYNHPLLWTRRDGDTTGITSSMVHSFYPQYFKQSGAKYLLKGDAWETSGHF